MSFDATTVVVAAIGMLVMALVSGILGGMVGGARAAFRLGEWRQAIEDKLVSHADSLMRINKRLDDGSRRLEEARVSQAVQEIIRAEFGDLKERCTNERGCIYGKIEENAHALAAMKARCDQTHKRGGAG